MRATLIFVTLIGLGAVVGAVVVGSLVFDGTVVEHPYERGIAWDDDRARHEASGITAVLVTASFRKGENDLVLRAWDRSGTPLEDERLSLRIGRISSGAHDRTYTATRRENGTYGASVELLLKGRWAVTVLVERGGNPLEFRHEITVEE
jgi:nitrogen fixation protein FixH